MQSTDPSRDDYECPTCFNNAYPCGCMTGKAEVGDQESADKAGDIASQEVEQAYKRYKLNAERAHYASEGRLGICNVCINGVTAKQFFRWRWLDKYGRFIQVPLPQEEQEFALALLEQLLKK